MRTFWARERKFLFGFGKFLLACLLVPVLGLSTSLSATAAPGDVQVSVFNMPGLNGSGCSGENENLIGIINAIPGYAVDGSIVDFVDQVGQTTLAAQLAASRFFFMTDMEGGFDPTSSANLPNSAKDAFRNWTNSGGVMVMTGTAGVKDVQFLNAIYNWDLSNQTHSTATEVTANTAGTPFANATGGVSLTQSNATDSIGAGTVPNFKAMWVTSSGNAEVAVIQYGAGYVIYLGWDFYNSGPSCGFYNDPWVQYIVPAALDYASELSQSGLTNATTGGGDLKYTFSQNGDAYYVIVPNGSAVPTAPEVKARANYGAVTISSSGTSAITANVEKTFNVTGLNAATDYTAYLVTEYLSGGNPTFSTQQVVNFSTKPGVPTVNSLAAGEGKVTANLSPFGTETNFEYSIDGGANWVARSPASVSSPWEITGLTNGTAYNFIFRSAFKTLRGDSTIGVSSTPAVQPALLSALVPSVGTLSPTFAGSTNSYSVTVDNATTSIQLTPTSAGNTITVEGQACTSGSASQAIALAVGSNALTVSVVKPLQGAVANVYTVTVTRSAPASSYTPPVILPPTEPAELSVTRSKTPGKSVLKIEVPPQQKDKEASKVAVKLYDTSGKFIKQIEVPVTSDVKVAEFEVDLKYGTFDAVVVASNTAGNSPAASPVGDLTLYNTVSSYSSGKNLTLNGVRLTTPLSFNPDSANISKNSVRNLVALAKSMESKNGRFMITGFVKEVGRSTAEEKRLATARAKKVAKILKDAGVRQWVQYFGFGTTGAKFGNSRSVEIRWVETK